MEKHQFVNWEPSEGVAVITLDRPPLNILSKTVHAELAACVEQAAAEPAVRVLVITGAGDRAFSAGADISEFQAEMRPGGGRERAEREHGYLNRLAALEKPTIAAINGVAFGGGLEVALACDLRIASENARLALPEIKLGVFPGGGGTERLPRLVGMARAKEMMFTGEPVATAEALRIGLVNRVTPAGQALAAALEVGRAIAAHSGAALGILKGVVDQSADMPVEQAAGHVGEALEKTFLTEDLAEGVKAFFEKRPAVFRHR